MSAIGPPLAAYLIGSISFSYLVVRLLRGIDIRRVGSGNAGATNVLRVAGLAPALAVLLLDMAKGAVPVAWTIKAGFGPGVVAATGVVAVLGHVFPLYLGLRGGKGVATAIGALSALAPWPTAIGVAALLAVVAWTRYVSLGSLVGVSLAPVLMLMSEVDGWYVAAAVATALLVIGRHSGNIRRLREGSERRFGETVEIAR